MIAVVALRRTTRARSDGSALFASRAEITRVFNFEHLMVTVVADVAMISMVSRPFTIAPALPCSSNRLPMFTVRFESRGRGS